MVQQVLIQTIISDIDEAKFAAMREELLKLFLANGATKIKMYNSDKIDIVTKGFNSLKPLSTTSCNKINYIYTQEDLDLSLRFYSMLDSTHPKRKRYEDEIKSGADCIRKMRTLDKRDSSIIESVVDFVFNDDFWVGVVFSPNAIRKNFDKLAARISTRPSSLQQRESNRFLEAFNEG